MSSLLKILKSFPNALLDCPAEEIYKTLSGPTLFELPGEKQEGLFISTLLHGNETTGFQAIQALLKDYQDKPLPRTLYLFLGNIGAARYRKRRLNSQLDYNRVWRGGSAPEQQMATALIKHMQTKSLLASVDIHNNTGKNPFYACINKLDNDFINLGHMFSDKLVYFTEPNEVQSMAFSAFCPSMTIECGRSEDYDGVTKVTHLLHDLLDADSFAQASPKSEFQVYKLIAKLMVPKDTTIEFADKPQAQSLTLLDTLEQLNFKDLAEDTLLGWSQERYLKLLAIDNQQCNVSDDYLQQDGGEIIIKKNVTPTMLTRNIDVINKDCLGYLMSKFYL